MKVKYKKEGSCLGGYNLFLLFYSIRGNRSLIFWLFEEPVHWPIHKALNGLDRIFFGDLVFAVYHDVKSYDWIAFLCWWISKYKYIYIMFHLFVILFAGDLFYPVINQGHEAKTQKKYTCWTGIVRCRYTRSTNTKVEFSFKWSAPGKFLHIALKIFAFPKRKGIVLPTIHFCRKVLVIGEYSSVSY